MEPITETKKKIRTFYQTVVLDRHELTESVFEIVLKRPAGFTFLPGQKVWLAYREIAREYTLVNSPESSELTLCVNHITHGKFSPLLAGVERGSSLSLSEASGYFTYQTQEKPAVFVATGTGIAPFLAFVRAGVHGFILLHGVRSEGDLLYRNEMSAAAGTYAPCLSTSTGNQLLPDGRVTSYLENCLARVAAYDFYLCGNADMVRDAFRIIDRRFSGSRVFVEAFF